MAYRGWRKGKGRGEGAISYGQSQSQGRKGAVERAVTCYLCS
jgi:hypothetical protein